MVDPRNGNEPGLAFLAPSDDSYVEAHLSTPLEIVLGMSLTNREELWAEIRRIRSRGYSINEEGLTTGISSVGAAITSEERRPVACVSISGLSNRITSEKFADYGEAVAATALEISRLIADTVQAR